MEGLSSVRLRETLFLIPSICPRVLCTWYDSHSLAKYNQLLRIETELGAAAKYPGMAFRSTGTG